jgi:probable phosphoglycerate mutase
LHGGISAVSLPLMLYLIRHGQTAYNLARRYQGALDSPLTSLGESQAVMAGRRLATLVPADTPIVAGPLGRAQRTAELIRDAGGFTAPILTEPRITEISLGRWDGMTDEEIEGFFPKAREGTTRYNWFFAAPEGETYAAFSGRLISWLDEAKAGPLPLICVSHGVASRVLRGIYTGLTKEAGLELATPQDAFFRLADGAAERIECEECATGA